MWILAACLFTVCFLDQTNASPKVSLEDLQERLESLEDWKREAKNEISALRDIVAEQGIIIRNLERELGVLANNTATLKQQQQNQHSYEHQTDEDERNVSEELEPKNRIRASRFKNPHTSQISNVDQRAVSGRVAFTAYLDHDENSGVKQVIRFNQIITNDGNAYNIYTGIFTCPEAGVYMFTFVIGQRGQDDGQSEMWAELVVNGHLLVGASADAYHNYQDLQGVNTVVVRLNQGDTVWVDAMYSNNHVEGSASLRFTSFTGIFLYA